MSPARGQRRVRPADVFAKFPAAAGTQVARAPRPGDKRPPVGGDVAEVVYALIAGAAALVGKRKVQQASPPVPERAIESTKEDVEWTRSRAKQARK